MTPRPTPPPLRASQRVDEWLMEVHAWLSEVVDPERLARIERRQDALERRLDDDGK